MHISGIYSSTGIEGLFTNIASQRSEDTFPARGQSPDRDSASISFEAMRLAKKAREEAEQATGLSEKDEKSGATEQFAEYMKKSRSKAQAEGSIEERIENLEKKLEQLQKQLGKNAESGDCGTEQSTQAQINAILAEIAQLKSQANKTAAS